MFNLSDPDRINEQQNSQESAVPDLEGDTSDITSDNVAGIRAKVDDQLDLVDRNQSIEHFVNELPRVDGFIDFSQLKKIGHGGTHDVFIYPENENFVVKLNREVLGYILRRKKEKLDAVAKAYAEDHVKNMNTENARLYSHFGSDNCLVEDIRISKIRMDGKNIEGPIDVMEGLVTVQHATTAFHNPTKLDLSTGYTEKDPSTSQLMEEYGAMNAGLLGNSDYDEEVFFRFHNKMDETFKLIDQDNKFAECLRKFVLTFKKYFSETGNFIDLVGEDNVLFYKDGDEWRYKIGSVLKGDTRENLGQALKLLEENTEKLNEESARALRIHLLNGVNLMRLLNATGIKLGVGKIFDITLTPTQLNNLKLVYFE